MPRKVDLANDYARDIEVPFRSYHEKFDGFLKSLKILLLDD